MIGAYGFSGSGTVSYPIPYVYGVRVYGTNPPSAKAGFIAGWPIFDTCPSPQACTGAGFSVSTSMTAGGDLIVSILP